VENFGILPRETVAGELRALDQQARAELRKFGVRFGAYNIYFPMLLKPAAADLLLLLWALKHGTAAGLNIADLPEPPRQGLTSVPVDVAYPPNFYRAAGFQICGPRAVRIDMLERLADLIRPLSSWKPTEANPNPPAGAVGRGGFKVQPEMMSIMGCSADELGNVLFSLGFRKERRPIQAKPVIAAGPVEAAAGEPSAEAEASAGEAAEVVSAENVSVEAAHADQTETTAIATSDESAPAQVSATDAEEAAAPPPVEAEAASLADAQPETVQAAGPSIGESVSTPSDVAASSEADAEAAIPADAAAPDEAGAEASAPEEPQFEEIWRPRRQGQGDERRAAHRRHDRPDRQGQNAPRDRGPRHGDRPTAATAAAAATTPPADKADQRPQGEQQRHGRRRDGDRRRDDQRRDDRPREGRPQEGRANEGRGRGDHRRDDHRKGGGGRPQSNAPRVQSASPRPQKDRAANADSPFAALMQLKEQLERRTQDQA
jgi:ATP-dependent RNA helicase SUPV3L1/SUV3